MKAVAFAGVGWTRDNLRMTVRVLCSCGAHVWFRQLTFEAGRLVDGCQGLGIVMRVAGVRSASLLLVPVRFERMEWNACVQE